MPGSARYAILIGFLKLAFGCFAPGVFN